MYTEEVDTEEKFAHCQGKECPYFTKNETSGHCIKVDFEKAVMINSTRIIIKEE